MIASLFDDICCSGAIALTMSILLSRRGSFFSGVVYNKYMYL